MDVRYLVVLLLFLTSCLPTADVRRSGIESSEAPDNTTGVDNPESRELSWNYLGQFSETITINTANLQLAYLAGNPVENYLNNFSNANNSQYCLVATFEISGTTHELRTRVIPLSYYDFINKRTIRIFRVDFQDEVNSQNHCQKSTRIYDSSGELVSDINEALVANRHYKPSTICSNCSYLLESTRIKIFQSDSSPTTMNEVALNFLNLQRLNLFVDATNSNNESVGTCSNSSCQSKGFDCCLNNQCVKDGALRPGAVSSYPSLYQTAEEEKLSNPLAYRNYPQLYYICGSNPPSGGGSSGGGSYDEAFNKLKKDYQCLQHIKSQITITPFHQGIIGQTFNPTTDCLTSPNDSTQYFYFKNVLKRMYTTCGCSKSTLSEMIFSCPNYDYKVSLTDTQGQPIKIDCSTPPTAGPVLPINQSVSVSSRSAPHRFFDSSGVEKSPSDGIQQELAEFRYLDDGKILPDQKEFSMNAILGQMNVSLSEALPAKVVSVELDQMYLLSTSSGQYTPCPSCAKDSWLNLFSAYPSSQMGTGLQAIGHTTERDQFSTNSTTGNYEDTIFGRACWLPPTMIPYSHSPDSSTITQRRNRLNTQAALFINGYQRDWFGFNKGALIGSFDGVSWFAIGKGRIVKSTSKKLFLAINAPFADLAVPSLHVVRVAAYDGITQAATLDYHPEYHQSHPLQNEAGNCQKYHLCQTDTDCITTLGWEYACADVSLLKTNWPEFDHEGNEIPNSNLKVGIDQILHQKQMPSSSNKRCVYRGAGAICHRNSLSLPSTDLNMRKLLTCGPNFYCASLSDNVHNSRIARFGSSLENIPVSNNHFFGKDANILGRPLDYLGTKNLNSFFSTIQSNLDFNSGLQNNFGLCRPGKKLPTSSDEVTFSNPFNQHQQKDPENRTDFISQMGSCNSTLFTSNRHTSCPVIASSGDYEIFSTPTLLSGFNKRASSQNSCGLESLLASSILSSPVDTLNEASPFKNIEAKPLDQKTVLEPTLVRDACLRRAGAVCHTDLDCSPNKMHASEVDLFPLSYFGNEAEKNYWSEFLVCGQSNPKPLISSSDEFKNFDMTKNRCCREVGRDLTTFTRDIPTDTFVNSSKPYLANSAGLKMALHPGTAPNDPKRYSRLGTVENIGQSSRPVLSANIDRTGNNLDPVINIATKNQWKTLNEANQETCCGGGWIRKFSDGTTDWTRRDRVVLDVTNFSCINSRTPLLTFPEDLQNEYSVNLVSLLSMDYGDYCKDALNLNGACAQYTLSNTSLDVPPAAGLSYNTITINTISPNYTTINPDFYFQPRSADGDPRTIIDTSVNLSQNPNSRTSISMTLPSYVTKEFDTNYNALSDGAFLSAHPIWLESSDGVDRQCIKSSTYSPNFFNDPAGRPNSPTGSDACFFSFNPSTRILKVGMNLYAWQNQFANKLVGLKIQNIKTPGQSSGLTRTTPGSATFYLKRLGRLELSGIPQMSFEKLTCNDNANRLVPGIFKESISNKTQFEAPDFSWRQTYEAKTASGANITRTEYFTNQHGLGHEAVFSASDFKCCAPLGSTVTDTTRCCSGYGLSQGPSNQRVCALPSGTNLMVYFNRFVSNEGRGADAPGGGLVETDFDELTGEPQLISSVSTKIRSLGEAYCESGSVRQGGAFGNYVVEPQGLNTDLASRIFNIVDSNRDIGQLSNAGSTIETGYFAFMSGFRWNHHLYCND